MVVLGGVFAWMWLGGWTQWGWLTWLLDDVLDDGRRVCAYDVCLCACCSRRPRAGKARQTTPRNVPVSTNYVCMSGRK